MKCIDVPETFLENGGERRVPLTHTHTHTIDTYSHMHATCKYAHEVTYLLDRDRQDYSAVEGERQELLSNPCLACPKITTSAVAE